MPTPLEVELKSYAHNLVATHLKEEYDSQIRGKWQPHINRMVDAQTEALKRHQKLLNDVRTQIEKEQEAAFGLAMLALSFVSGPILSWVAGKIQYKWFPKFAEKQKIRDRALWISAVGTEKWKRYQVLELDHNKVWAKVFGDLGKQIAGLGVDAAHKVVTPDSNPAQNAIQTAANSSQSSFKTNLENAMLAEADLTIKAILSLAMSINEDSGYGAKCLEKLKRLNPRAKNPKASENELELLAKQMIRSDLNKQRQQWADEWFYYGYDPGPSAGMAESIELELWGLWILNEQLKLTTHYHGSTDNPMVSAEVQVVESTTFRDRGVPEGILIRLAEFGVVEAQTELQRLRAIAARIAKDQMEEAAARARSRNRRAPRSRKRSKTWRTPARIIPSWHNSIGRLRGPPGRIKIRALSALARGPMRRIRTGR